MTLPAREVFEPSHPVTSPRRSPVGRPASAPGSEHAPVAMRPVPAAGRRPRTSPSPSSRRRGGVHGAFWVLTAAVVTGMFVGRASVSALLVQTSFRIDELESTIASERDAHEVLTEQVASRSSPSKIAAWARARGMVMPEDVVVVQVLGAARPGGSES